MVGDWGQITPWWWTGDRSHPTGGGLGTDHTLLVGDWGQVRPYWWRTGDSSHPTGGRLRTDHTLWWGTGDRSDPTGGGLGTGHTLLVGDGTGHTLLVGDWGQVRKLITPVTRHVGRSKGSHTSSWEECTRIINPTGLQNNGAIYRKRAE